MGEEDDRIWGVWCKTPDYEGWAGFAKIDGLYPLLFTESEARDRVAHAMAKTEGAFYEARIIPEEERQ